MRVEGSVERAAKGNSDGSGINDFRDQATRNSHHVSRRLKWPRGLDQALRDECSVSSVLKLLR